MKKIFGLLLLCFTCCDVNGQSKTLEQEQNSDMHKYVESIRYCKDIRTGLCFAGCPVYANAYNAVLANVPCTPEVEKLIK